MVSKGYSSLLHIDGMSPPQVYGYHTCLFSQAASKLSFVVGPLPQHWPISGFHGRSHEVG